MCRESIRAALIRMGYGPDSDSDSPMTAHGFRGMASTLLHEQGWNTDVIERQLAHMEGNKVKAAYNHVEHLPERRKMMQAWADYLDGLRKGALCRPNRLARTNEKRIGVHSGATMQSICKRLYIFHIPQRLGIGRVRPMPTFPMAPGSSISALAIPTATAIAAALVRFGWCAAASDF